jgi:hypothetical protein
MAYVPKAGAPEYVWADIVPLLQRYFIETDSEYEWYFNTFHTWTSLRLIELAELAAVFVMPTGGVEEEDFISGDYKEKLWQYAYAQIIVEHCDEV